MLLQQLDELVNPLCCQERRAHTDAHRAPWAQKAGYAIRIEDQQVARHSDCRVGQCDYYAPPNGRKLLAHLPMAKSHWRFREIAWSQQLN